MAENFFSLYDTIIFSVPSGLKITGACAGERWSMASNEHGSAIAMSTRGNSIEPMFSHGLVGLDTAEAAKGIKSWNMEEASLALAAVNAALNTNEQVSLLRADYSMDRYYTDGLDFKGKTVGLIGHLHGSPEMRRDAKEVYIIEREPQEGDYPDAACDFILPKCDIAIITGSSIINKTLPHLLALCKNAYTILTGPSVPLCPGLLNHGVDRLSGMVVTDADGMRSSVITGQRGSPYRYGKPFLLVK